MISANDESISFNFFLIEKDRQVHSRVKELTVQPPVLIPAQHHMEFSALVRVFVADALASLRPSVTQHTTGLSVLRNRPS